MRAFRTSALQGLKLISDGPGIGAEILVKLAAQSFRFSEVSLDRADCCRARVRSPSPGPARHALPVRLPHQRRRQRARGVQHARATRGCASLQRLARHEAPARTSAGGYSRSAPASARSPGRSAEGRERVIALEADPYYAQRLANLFRGSPVVRTAPRPGRGDRLGCAGSGAAGHRAAQQRAGAHRGRRGGGPAVPIRAPRRRTAGASSSPRFQRCSEASTRRSGTTVATHLRPCGAVIEPNGFQLEHLEWLNLLGIAGWFLNGRVLRRRVLPPAAAQDLRPTRATSGAGRSRRGSFRSG